jgi:hypothetical protein
VAALQEKEETCRLKERFMYLSDNVFSAIESGLTDAFKKKQSVASVAEEIRSQYGMFLAGVLDDLPPKRMIERLEEQGGKSILLTPKGKKFLVDLAQVLKLQTR